MKRNLTLVIIFSITLAGCSLPSVSSLPLTTAGKVAATSVGGNASKDVSDNVDVENAEPEDIANAAMDSVKAQAQEAGAHAQNLNSAASGGFYESVDHVADWMKPTKPKPTQAIAASYCYHVLQDILCYRRPMPGWEGRLAGYQPLGAEPPVPAMMQPMPHHTLDASQLPANRVVAAKPVFTQMPAQAAAEKPPEDAATPAAAAASEATHEQLPDPALAPQL